MVLLYLTILSVRTTIIKSCYFPSKLNFASTFLFRRNQLQFYFGNLHGIMKHLVFSYQLRLLVSVFLFDTYALIGSLSTTIPCILTIRYICLQFSTCWKIYSRFFEFESSLTGINLQQNTQLQPFLKQFAFVKKFV